MKVSEIIAIIQVDIKLYNFVHLVKRVLVLHLSDLAARTELKRIVFSVTTVAEELKMI